MLRNTAHEPNLSFINLFGVLPLLTTGVFEVTEHFQTNTLISLMHCFLAWPSILEAVMMLFLSMFLRNVEYVMGTKPILSLLFYNLIIYLIPYLLVIYFAGADTHFSFLLFPIHAIFIYSLWSIPATRVFLCISDKLISLCIYIGCLFFEFPFTFIPLSSGFIGLMLYYLDPFKLARLSPKDNYVTPAADEADPIRSLIELGFTEAEARNALSMSDGNIEHAANHLLEAL